MSFLAVSLWILNIALDTAGHLALKSAALTEHETEWRRWRAMFQLPVMWLGVSCFVFEFLVWLALLSLIPLSMAVLIGSINTVAVVVAGRLLFHERLDRMRVAGIWLIAAGVFMAGGLT